MWLCPPTIASKPVTGCHQVGIHIGIHLHTGGIFRETDMRQSDHHVICRPKQVGKFLRFGNGITEGQPGNIAGKFVIRHPVVANSKDGNIDITQIFLNIWLPLGLLQAHMPRYQSHSLAEPGRSPGPVRL